MVSSLISAMDIAWAQKIYNDLYEGVDGYGLAFGVLGPVETEERHLTYGEIKFDSFVEILSSVPKIDQCQVFYDFGSGVGKAVLAAHLLAPFFSMIALTRI